MGIAIAVADPAGEVAARLLARYFAELDALLATGFDPARTVAAPADELVTPRGAFLVARVDDEPAGCGGVRLLEPGVAEIKRMWVDPAVRGRGLGRRLLTALEDAARDLGCSSVRLDTSADLAVALALYRRSGYAEIPAYNDNAYAAHWFAKRLT